MIAEINNKYFIIYLKFIIALHLCAYHTFTGSHITMGKKVHEVFT